MNTTTDTEVYVIRQQICSPEGMNAVDDSRHVLAVIQVSRDWIEKLKQVGETNKTSQSTCAPPPTQPPTVDSYQLNQFQLLTKPLIYYT